MNLTMRTRPTLALLLLALPALAVDGDAARDEKARRLPEARATSPARPVQPGAEGGGVTLLPNGWRIAPAGRHLTVGDLPLAMLESADGRHVVVGSRSEEHTSELQSRPH